MSRFIYGNDFNEVDAQILRSLKNHQQPVIAGQIFTSLFPQKNSHPQPRETF